MPVIANCQECKAKLKFPDTAVGKKVRCPKCKGEIAVSKDAKPVNEGITAKESSKPKESAPSRDTTADDFSFSDPSESASRSGSRRSRSSRSRDEED